MKNIKFLVFCVFVIVMMILSSEMVRVDGRHLTTKHHCKKHCSKDKGNKNFDTNAKGVSVSANGAYSSSYAETNASKVEHAEDFRPTAPGHSSGVGHSVHG